MENFHPRAAENERRKPALAFSQCDITNCNILSLARTAHLKRFKNSKSASTANFCKSIKLSKSIVIRLLKTF